MTSPAVQRFQTSIAPWLVVSDAARAEAFYKAAFGAEALYRLEGDDGTLAVVQLSVLGAEFWVQRDSESGPTAHDAWPIRMILSVEDPDVVFRQAVAVGAIVVNPVAEAYGWRTGRFTDPFGHDWEVSRKLGP